MTVAKALVRKGLHDWGGLAMFRARHAHQWRILMYHEFRADASGLRRQCEHIVRYYTPVSMAQIAEALERHQSLPPNAVAVTVDDGFRDFLLNGFPVFQEFGIVPTVFLITDFLDRRCWPWWKEIEYAIENTRQSTIEGKVGEKVFSLTTVTSADKARAVDRILEILKDAPNGAREYGKNEVVRKLGVTLPPELPRDTEPLAWEEVRNLAAQGVEFGAHTRTHPILSSVGDEAQLHDEIAGSKRRIEQELQTQVLHFCYPNGRPQDIGPRALEFTRRAGFRTAVTAEAGMNMPAKTDAFFLRRLAVRPTTPDYHFAELLAGARKY